MTSKRIIIILAVLFCFSGSSLASPANNDVQQAKVIADRSGELYYFWLEQATAEGLISNEAIPSAALYCSKSPFVKREHLYSFSQEVSSYDIKVADLDFYLTFTQEEPGEGKSKIYLVAAPGQSLSSAAPRLISEPGENPSLALADHEPILAWEAADKIYYHHFKTAGLFNTLEAKSIEITNEVLSQPRLLMDSKNKLQIIFIAQNKDTNLNRIIYSSLPTFEPQVIYQSHDNLTNPQIAELPEAIIISGQKEYLERRTTFFLVSLDGGQNFGSEKYPDFEERLLGCYLAEEQLQLISQRKNKLLFSKLAKEFILTPKIIQPLPAAAYNQGNYEITYSIADKNPFIAQIELSSNKSFPLESSWSFNQIIASVSQESFTFKELPELKDGTYFVRLRLSNGIEKSNFTEAVEFKIDNTPPQIQTLEAFQNKNMVTLTGIINEAPCWLTINHKPVTIINNAADLALPQTTFNATRELQVGQNILTLLITDEANNLAVMTQEVFYDPAAPQLSLIKPKQSDWFKPNSIIVIEALVEDLENDIQDEAEAQILINNQPLEESLIFDQAEGKLSGFIMLPDNLRDGTYAGTIILTDKSGKTGQTSFMINIDGSPPQIETSADEAFYSNSPDSFVAPLTDAGIGLDAAGTLLKIEGISLEGKPGIEAEKLVYAPALPLKEGTYEVTVIGRDRIGNTTEAISLALVVDTTPPDIILLSSCEANVSSRKILISGRIFDRYPDCLKIYINKKEVAQQPLSGDLFSSEISLFPGDNDISVEVFDKAGNRASQGFSVFADIAAAQHASLIESCIHGPNPFSPSKNLPSAFSSQSNSKGMVFSYTLSESADIKVMIFDLTGKLIWSKEEKNVSSGTTAWNGIDQFGQTAQNGIYPYIIAATSGGKTEIKRGKIIVFH